MKKFKVILSRTLLLVFCVFSMTFLLTACFGDGESGYQTQNYKFTYHLNGGEPCINQYYDQVDENTVKKEMELVKPQGSEISNYKLLEVERETWIFDGWYTDSEFTNKFVFDAQTGANIELFAKWTDKVTITKENFKQYFNISSSWNGGMTTMNAAVNFSFEPKQLFDPARCTGMIEISATPKLGGWYGTTRNITLSEQNNFSYYGAEIVNMQTSFILGSSTLNYEIKLIEPIELFYLHKDPIDVTLALDGGTLADGNILKVSGGDKLKKDSLPTPTKEGYRFINWYADAEFSKVYSDTVITRPKTIYAKFTQEITYSFNTLGGTEKEPVKFLVGSSINLGSEPTKEGFGFFGWYTDPECIVPFTNKTATKSQTLYARWEPYRTVSFDTKGGSDKSSIKVLNTKTLSDDDFGNEPTKSNLIFEGWFTDELLTTKYDAEPITSDITLYAAWSYDYSLVNKPREILDKFFDINITMERKQITEGRFITNKLVTTISIELKEEFKNNYVVAHFNFSADYTSESGEFCGNFLVDKYISTLSGKTTILIEEMTGPNNNAYENADHIKIDRYITYGSIHLPEGYVVE